MVNGVLAKKFDLRPEPEPIQHQSSSRADIENCFLAGPTVWMLLVL